MNRDLRWTAVPEGLLVLTKRRQVLARRTASGSVSVSVGKAHSARAEYAPFLRGPARAVCGLWRMLRVCSGNRADVLEKVSPLRLGPIRISSPSVLAWLTGFWLLLLATAGLVVIPWALGLALTDLASLRIHTASLLAGLFRALLFIPIVRAASHARFLRRLSMYRGAYGKAVNCAAADKPMNVEEALACPRLTGGSIQAVALLAAFVLLLLLPVLSAPNIAVAALIRLAVYICLLSVLEELRRLCQGRNGPLSGAVGKLFRTFESPCVMEPHTEALEVALKALEAVLRKEGKGRQ